MISIILPVYNTADYLPRCIDSILAQSYADWELVAIDDGSRDNSLDVLNRYATADSRIHVLSQPNSGVSVARNNGLANARGQWVTFVDSDDYVSEDYLKNMMDATEVRDDVDAVVAGWSRDGVDEGPEPCVMVRPDYVGVFTSSVNYGYVCGKLYRMSMLRDNGIVYDVGVKWAEDAFFFFRVLLSARCVVTIGSCDYQYITRGGSGVSRLHGFDVEYAGFKVSDELSRRLVNELNPLIGNHYSPYAHLYRVVLTQYDGKHTRSERLAQMRKLDFDAERLNTRTKYANEKLYFWLIKHRQWRVLDIVLSFVLRKGSR